MFSSDLALEQAILKEVVYFDLFDYPLTILEIWRNLEIKKPYSEVYQALRQNAWLTQRLQSSQGLWYLRGRGGNVLERRQRYRLSKHKLDIARRFVYWARRVPWIRAIYACNSLGFLHARAESDIDIFIVAKRWKIWCARFFAVLIAKAFGRPRGAQTKDRICLSFFAAEGAHLGKAALKGGDVYFRHWQTNLLSLYQRAGVAKSGGETVLEKILRFLQMKMMPASLRAMANQGTGVVISEEFLKFHDHDRREYFRKEYEHRLAAISA